MSTGADLSSLARTEACLAAIERHDGTVNAMITVTADRAREEAAAADAAAEAGRWLGLLHGMPIAIKDNIDTAGVRTTSGSLFFADHVPNHDAPVVERLRRAGAVMVGKATMHELAFGVRSYNPVSGQCRNPWNPERIPGGSSGGSGAAVAAGMCEAALGTDTGGSVRIPASVNGVSGLRPTVGRVSNHGCTPVSATFDTIGPMARSVADVARLFAVMAGFDPQDPVSVDRPLENFLPGLGDGVAGLRIGLPTNFYFEDVDPGIERAVRAAADVLAGLGAALVPVAVPGAENAHLAATTMIFADVCAVHDERLATAPDKFAPPVLERMSTARTYSALDYARALRAREAFKAGMREVFGKVDVLLTPTIPMPVPPIEDGQSLLNATKAVTRFTYAGALAQLPGLSVPCGFTGDGMPVGLQLEAAWWQEPLLLRVGHAYQGATDWHMRRPPLLG